MLHVFLNINSFKCHSEKYIYLKSGHQEKFPPYIQLNTMSTATHPPILIDKDAYMTIKLVPEKKIY